MKSTLPYANSFYIRRSPPANWFVVISTRAIGRAAGFVDAARSGGDSLKTGLKVDALTAEKVFGWKNVHKHQ